MRKSFVFLLCLPLAASAADIRLTPEQTAQAGIRTAALADMKQMGGIRLPAQVVVPPGQIEVIAAPLPSMVAAVRVAYGEAVKKGQPLLKLQGAQFLELQRDQASAEAQARLAADNLRRDEALFADGIIPQSRLSASRAAERQAAALAAEKRQALQLAGLAKSGALSGSAELRAPFDGVVLEAPAQPGQRVDAQTPLLTLGRLAPLWLEIQASPAQATEIAAGDAVAVPGCAQPARIKLIAPHLQAASQSLLIRAELARPAGCVKPFQYVQATVSSGKPLPAGHWRVPVTALARHQGQTWVFLEVADAFRPVTARVVDETPEAATIAAELPAAARLAVQGVATLKATWLGLGAGE